MVLRMERAYHRQHRASEANSDCGWGPQVRMAKVFQAVCQIMVDEKIFTSHKHLPFEGFEEVLCRVAVQLISTAYYSATVEVPHAA